MKIEEVLMVIIGILSLIIFYKIYKGSLVEGAEEGIWDKDCAQPCSGLKFDSDAGEFSNQNVCKQHKCGADAKYAKGDGGCPNGEKTGDTCCDLTNCSNNPPPPPTPPTSKLSPNTTCKAFMNSETFKKLSFYDSYVLDEIHNETECNEGENEENSCMTNMDNGGNLYTEPCFYKFDTTDFKTTCGNYTDLDGNSDYTPKSGNSPNSKCCKPYYNSSNLNPDETLACNFGNNDKLKTCNDECSKPPPYIPAIGLPGNITCENMESDWVRPISDNDGKKKYCNVYYNIKTKRRCKPGGSVCMEGDYFNSSIKCEKLIDSKKCDTITNDDVKLGVPFADGNRWNQGLCQAYQENGNICVGSPMGSGHPCIKSNEKKCLL
jgi:hypothetical protein